MASKTSLTDTFYKTSEITAIAKATVVFFRPKAPGIIVVPDSVAPLNSNEKPEHDGDVSTHVRISF